MSTRYGIDSQKALVENRLVQFTPFAELLYSDGTDSIATTKRKLIGWIPKYSIIIACYALKLASFNAGGNDYLTVGDHDTDDLLINDLDISTAAATIPVITDTTTFPYYVSTETAFYASYVYSSTAPSTGKIQVALMWVPWIQRDLDVGAIVT